MSDKSGVSRQAVPLPEGGGAIAAIGETFSPDLFTGTGNLSIPLAVPPGRREFQPQLRLSYSSGAGGGPFGLGWDLSIGGISRSTSRGIPRYRDATASAEGQDTFVLAGADDLVPVATDGDVARYRPRTETTFSRVERVRNGVDDFWRVRTRDGLVTLYGTPRSIGDDPATIADPDDRARVFAWLPSLTLDPFGNRIEYRYRRDLGRDGMRAWDQLYLEFIRYVDFEGDGAERRFLVSVDLTYDERPDLFSHRRAGFEVCTRLRCRSIDVHTGETRLWRRYQLVYLDDRVTAGELAAGVLPANGVSLLSQLRVTGHDGDRTESLPPLEFGYSRLDLTDRPSVPLSAGGSSLPARSLADPDVELVGLFGNGLPDLIEMNGVARFWRNRGGGRFEGPTAMDEVPAGVRLGDPGVQLGDMNGDGRPDLLVLNLSGYFPLAFGGRWSRDGFVRYGQRPLVDPAAAELRLVDLDGDGVVDALRTGVEFELFFNDPAAGWTTVETRRRRPLEEFPDLRFSDPRVRLADLTGDGLQDFVLVEQGRVSYWPYRGHGRWDGRIVMENSPLFPDEAPVAGFGFDPRRVLFGDVDGDGRDDLVFVGSDRVTIWLNQGERWGSPVEIDGTPTFTQPDAVRLVDMWGTGIPGVLWSSDRLGPSAENYRYLDLTGGVKPYLLNRIDNHRGSVTTIDYVASIEFSMEDERAGRPWSTPLPFPVRVVARVTVDDALSAGRLVTEFRYHHGYWDGSEREFRGFGMVEQVDTETFTGPTAPASFAAPVLTRTWFHQGPVGDEFGARHGPEFTAEYWSGDPPLLSAELLGEQRLERLPSRTRAGALRSLRGSVLRTEVYALDGTDREDRPYTVTESLYSAREEPASLAGGTVAPSCFFPHVLAQRVTQWERGEEPMTVVTRPGDYDDAGQPHTTVRVGVPRRRDPMVPAAPGPPYLVTRTTTAYASGTGTEAYIRDRVARTTTEQIVNDGSQSLGQLLSANTAVGERRLLADSATFYDGEGFTGLPLGRLGRFGAAVRAETLVLTPELAAAAFPTLPPYLVPGAQPLWTDDYPQAFRETMAPLAGYVFHGGEDGRARGWYAVTRACAYDFQDDPDRRGRGLVTRERDALGNETRTDYDGVGLLVATATDAAGLSTHVEYDERVLQPRMVNDPNGNRTQFGYTPLGLVESVALLGKPGENEGDTAERPSLRFVHDLDAFDREGEPLSVRTVSRVHHAAALRLEDDEVVESVAYYDGFGRQLQVRAMAPAVTFGDRDLDAPLFGDGVLPADADDEAGSRADVVGRVGTTAAPVNVSVTGVQRNDNKGRVIERYEPYFGTGLSYRSPEEEQRSGREALGAPARLFYDPRGQVIRTVHPDGSERRVVFGVPGRIDAPDLADPDLFEPTPWEAYTYDPNDNAGRSGAAGHDAGRYAHHWNTPSSLVVDAFGRTVVSVVRNREANGREAPLPAPDLLVTTTRHDLRGNPTELIDPEGRTATSTLHDLQNRPVRTVSIDGGDRWAVRDAMGRPVEEGNARGTLVLRSFDALGRLSCVWGRSQAGAVLGLRSRLEYGDDEHPEQDPSERQLHHANNRLGRLHRQYDGGGRFTCERYDFKGNPCRKLREVFTDDAVLGFHGSGVADWGVPDRVALESRAATVLEPAGFQTIVDYDALNRVRRLQYPTEANGRRRGLIPSYSAAGALERLELDGEAVIDLVAYDARGHRVLVVYGNGVMTRYAYDRRNSRMLRLRSERFVRVAGQVPIVRPSDPAHPLQDCSYEFDLVGNIVGMRQRGPRLGVPSGRLGPDALDRTFEYDALYRLVSATGRECAAPGPSTPGIGGPRCADAAATREYTEGYQYDRVDNLVAVRHRAGEAQAVTMYRIQQATNRVGAVEGAGALRLEYDATGNLVQMGSAHHLEWDHFGRLASFRIQADGADPPVRVRYLYALDGQRVKTLRQRQDGLVETTVSVEGLLEHHRRRPSTGAATESSTLHIMDGTRRIAEVVTTADGSPPGSVPGVSYHLGDHLGSSEVVVGGMTLADSAFLSREEYAPYGETTFGSFAGKRHRFGGAERDDESGLVHQGHRYYAPWLCRWISPDPAGPIDGPNAYLYARANPLRFVDPMGTFSWDWARTAADWVWTANVWVARSPWDWQQQSLGMMWNGIESAWAHAPVLADNLVDWVKSHWLLTSVLAVGAATVGYFKGAWLWDNVAAPTIRTGVNALLGYAIGNTTGAIIGGITGAIQGFSMAYADSYDWKSGWSWMAFILDNSWSQFNSLIGSGFAVLNVVWNPIDEEASKGSTTVVYEHGWVPNYSTTIGNVTAGNRKDYQAHERSHAWQGRLLGPFYAPAVLINYEIAAVLPYWLIWDHDEIDGVGDYFIEGVYHNVWHELISYKWF